MPKTPDAPATPEIRWTDPPESAARTTANPDRYTAIITELRKNPDRWAIVADVKSGSRGYQLRKGIRAGKWGFGPAGAFDAVTRTTDGQTRVLACFKAETEADAAEQPAAQ